MATLTGTYVTVNIPGGSSLEVDTGYVGETFQLIKTDNSCYTFTVQAYNITTGGPLTFDPYIQINQVGG